MNMNIIKIDIEDIRFMGLYLKGIHFEFATTSIIFSVVIISCIFATVYMNVIG